MQVIFTEHTLEQLIKSINRATQSITFKSILTKLNEKYSFKCSLRHVKVLENHQNAEQFLRDCYRLVMAKLAHDELIEKIQWTLKEEQKMRIRYLTTLIHRFAIEISPKVKKNYCRIMESISDGKSTVIEFFLFLIFLSSEEVVLSISRNFQNIRGTLNPKLMEKTGTICQWACIMINFQITSVKVSPDVYNSLKKRYLKHEKKRVKKQCSTVSNLSSSYMNAMHDSNENPSKFHSSNKSRKSEIEQKNRWQLLEQIGNIFGFNENSKMSHKQKNKENEIEPKNKGSKKYRGSIEIECMNSTLKVFQKCAPKIIGFSSMRNSDAFAENHNVKEKSKKVIEPHAKSMAKHKRGKTVSKHKTSNSHFNLLTASLAFLTSSKQKCSHARELEKPSVSAWKIKIEHIRNSSNIDHVRLNSHVVLEQKRGKICDDEKIYEKSEKQVLFRTHRFETPKKHESTERTTYREGFCQFIDNREPEQIGIVQNVVNFTSYSPNPKHKHKKIQSKELKNEYSEFLKKMQLGDERYLNQKSHDYRMQMVLAGLTK